MLFVNILLYTLLQIAFGKVLPYHPSVLTKPTADYCNLVSNGEVAISLDVKVEEPCNGWGSLVDEINYEKNHFECYLTMLNYFCCCMWKPDCPEGLDSEEDVIPYKIYDVNSLNVACKKPTDHLVKTERKDGGKEETVKENGGKKKER